MEKQKKGNPLRLDTETWYRVTRDIDLLKAGSKVRYRGKGTSVYDNAKSYNFDTDAGKLVWVDMALEDPEPNWADYLELVEHEE